MNFSKYYITTDFYGQAEKILAVSLSRFYVISNYTIELKTVSKTTADVSKSTGV